ncbi:MAG: hypothetical protein ACI4F4_07005 [Lachnospiraceae bacterium]
MKRSSLDFIFYDVVKDCVNPETGEYLVNFLDSPLERYYSFRNNTIDYDADVSIEANVIYKEVFPFINRIDEKVIRPQMDHNGKYNRYGLKYELGEPDCMGGLSYRGDTMNSVATTNRAYYWFHKELHKKNEPFPWPKEALDFMDVYHTPGNFMVLPFRSKFSLNQARGCGESKDYFDLYLLAIYHFFLEMNGETVESDVTLSFVLGYDRRLVLMMQYFLMPFIEEDKCRYEDHDCQLVDDIADTRWMIQNILPGWQGFVIDNCFEDFVTCHPGGYYGEPKELWKGHFTNYSKNNCLPYKENQFFEYWTNATEWIKNRSYRIYRKLQDRDGNTDDLKPDIFNL